MKSPSNRGRPGAGAAAALCLAIQVPAQGVAGVGVPAPAEPEAVQVMLAALDFQRFKDGIQILASSGDRAEGSPSYRQAAAWIEMELERVGYEVEFHDFTRSGGPRRNIYATRVGRDAPDRMYIVSAHLDGRGNGGAADDDASGCSLVLEAARAFARPEVEPGISVRFIFWDSEETGLNGSRQYVQERERLRGIESPPGSGRYPEPSWLGIIQHDMILYDHGLPPQEVQIPLADLDIEYASSSLLASKSAKLAQALQAGNQAFALSYPAQVSGRMCCTDSMSFLAYTAAVSVRENRRQLEIGNGSNPNYHRASDVFEAYDDLDFSLGFDAVRTTVGTVARLSLVRHRVR